MYNIFRSTYKWDNSKGMPAHVFYSNNYDALIASRKLDDTLTDFDVQECNMENQFKLVILYELVDIYSSIF